MHFIIYFPKLFTVHYVSNSFDFLKDPIYWVVLILENENRTCLRHLSSILFLAPFRKKHLAYIEMLISTLSKKKNGKRTLHFIISLNFFTVHYVSNSFYFWKDLDLLSRLTLGARKQCIVHLSSIFFFAALRKKTLKGHRYQSHLHFVFPRTDRYKQLPFLGASDKWRQCSLFHE